jgi:hypothetical protein
MSNRELAKSAAGKMVLEMNSFVNNEPESSSSSSSSPRESQSDRLKSAQEAMLEHMFAKNQFPSDDGYADLAKKVKKSVQEVSSVVNERLLSGSTNEEKRKTIILSNVTKDLFLKVFKTLMSI